MHRFKHNREQKRAMCVNNGQTKVHIYHPYFTTNVYLYDKHKPWVYSKNPKFHNKRGLFSAKFTGYLTSVIYILVRTTHNSMQVTTGHYERHKWHNTCRKDLPWFLETRTHHHKKCSRYAYTSGKMIKY